MSVKFRKLTTKKSTKIKLWTMDCGLWTNKGIALLMILIMLSTLAGVVMICAFVLGHEVDKDERHQITRQRMLEVRRALIGRLADVGGGAGITSSGGFISDFGEPVDKDAFDVGNLLSRSEFTVWAYNDTYKFWAGYKGERYLNPPPGEMEFGDGWGNIMQVRFAVNQIEIESWGSDGVDDGITSPTNYDRDIVDTFYWRRNVTVNVNNTSAIEITVRLIYPSQGIVQATPISTVNAGVTSAVTFNNIPVGLRKIEILEGVTVKQTKVFSLPSGSGIYTMEQIIYSG